MAGNGFTTARVLLLVSRDPSELRCCWTVGEANSWQLETASSGWEALERIQSGASLDLVLLDLAPGDADGMHTLRWLRRVCPTLPIILISCSDDPQQKEEAMRSGAQEFLRRPLQPSQLETVIRRHLGSGVHNGDEDIASDDIEQISDDLFFVGASPMMRKLRAQAELLARVNVPVLIVGESGSGKEVAARLIHKLSVRSAFRFLKVNCAALPGDLLESELFGYERGAFIGALRTKAGKFELCQKGTILLDEFAEMPTGLQAKLLHVLQDKQFFRLGGETMINVDVRILTTTNVNIEQALAEKKLREDLYYRLSAFTLYVPPLRQRRDEIPLLLGHFMSRLARHYGLHPRIISRTMADACQSCSWPGNLTELENFVKRYLVMGDEELALGELGSNSQAPETIDLPQTSSWLTGAMESAELEESPSGLKSLVQSVKGEAERNAITAALGKTYWNRRAAAQLLKVSYRTLLYKIERYHLSPPVSHFGKGAGS